MTELLRFCCWGGGSYCWALVFCFNVNLLRVLEVSVGGWLFSFSYLFGVLGFKVNYSFHSVYSSFCGGICCNGDLAYIVL